MSHQNNFKRKNDISYSNSENKNKLNNNKYDNNDSCMIKIQVTDDGREEIRVSAWINEGDAENKLV